MVQMIK